MLDFCLDLQHGPCSFVVIEFSPILKRKLRDFELFEALLLLVLLGTHFFLDHGFRVKLLLVKSRPKLGLALGAHLVYDSALSLVVSKISLLALRRAVDELLALTALS